mmetsp:Transcript_132635/g.412413  ORF Transcript_132635/g.412413 Transcript_132635/m.412413 type:complete len:211 (+) Transcript_132635:36-668(+)
MRQPTSQSIEVPEAPPQSFLPPFFLPLPFFSPAPSSLREGQPVRTQKAVSRRKTAEFSRARTKVRQISQPHETLFSSKARLYWFARAIMRPSSKVMKVGVALLLLKHMQRLKRASCQPKNGRNPPVQAGAMAMLMHTQRLKIPTRMQGAKGASWRKTQGRAMSADNKSIRYAAKLNQANWKMEPIMPAAVERQARDLCWGGRCPSCGQGP